jgi:cation diffusion facilitator CzcD-associated flavoprotein CzcO
VTRVRECAIVGGGLAGFVAYATLRHGGVDDVAVFDPGGSDPAGVWRARAGAIRQRRMRSESDGHCLPTTFPGLAVRTAVRRRNPWPLLQSVCDRYHPTVAEFLEHVEEVRARSEWDAAVVPQRVERVAATTEGFDVQGAVFRHVLVATGHPGLNVPVELADDPRVVHAYEPHEYAADVAVVGAGMAAATEWLNALEAGARVTSVRRREPSRRPLNVPRELFSRRGLAAFHAAPPAARAAQLAGWLAPSYPPGRAWDEPLAAAGDRFRVAAEVNGAEQIVCATGFRRGFREDPLLARLVDEHVLETHDRWLVLAPDCTVPALTDESRTLALAGIGAQWAYPGADTLVGAKYAARGFLRRVRACRTR